MAIDSKAKRSSCLGIALTALRNYAVTLGGGIPADDRLHSVQHYRGIAAAAPGGFVPAVLQRSTHRFVFGRVFGRVN